jgi:hypothetical protein
MGPSRRDLLGVGCLVVLLVGMVVIIVLGAIPAGGPPTLH